MNINWFKNQDNVVYANTQEFIDNFAKETGISDLGAKIAAFKKDPTPEGVTVTGKKRTSIKLLVPNLTFREEIEMGENVWIYMGENYESYCLY
ncbi:hypothetical protein Ami103574_10115 [Aminipila butyrica]|uniref:Uncharacterized protein n=1 Tax=Aminipila butyrica TaxID=433296 RepID=A0A858BY64_9FIRM|nr:hypothetical protein [Aminipila butyrica]QIB69654.1 hypothetical protein Ami103574_10115 [Aminipila butyrica]